MLRAVDIAILGIADATTSLRLVPVVVSESLRILDKVVSFRIIERSSLEGHILDESALSVSRAIIRARGSRARFPLIARKTFTLSSIAIANTLVRAFRIFVVGALLIGRIYPSKFIWTNSL
jgi:hypothetical protein